MIRAALTASALLLAGCTVRDGFTGEFACTERPVCPGGYQCVDGVCLMVDPFHDGGNPDGAEGPPTCATTEGWTASLDERPGWAYVIEQGGATITYAGGEAVLAVPAGMPDAYASLRNSTGYLDLRQRAVTVEVAEAGGEATVLAVEDPRLHDAAMVVAGGRLRARADDATLADVPYAPAAHRWWRLREDRGPIVWETSPDGTTWTELHRATLELDPRYVALLLDLLGEGTAARARFATLNPGQDPSIRWCPITEIGNDFRSDRSPAWTGVGTNCTFNELDGALQLAMAGASGFCVYGSARPVDASGGSVAARISTPRQVATTRLKLISTDQRHVVSFEVDDRYHFHVQAAGIEVLDAHADLEATLPPYWRVRLASPMVLFETSENGIDWLPRASTVAAALDPTAMTVELSTSLTREAATPVLVTFSELTTAVAR